MMKAPAKLEGVCLLSAEFLIASKSFSLNVLNMNPPLIYLDLFTEAALFFHFSSLLQQMLNERITPDNLSGVILSFSPSTHLHIGLP